MLSTIPLVVAGGSMAILTTKLTSKVQLSYAEARNILEQTLGAIRTRKKKLWQNMTGHLEVLTRLLSSKDLQQVLHLAFSSCSVLQPCIGSLVLGSDIAVFNCICSSYPAWPNVQIFSGFSLKIPSGTTAALVGESGSGKSTVISLLDRFQEPVLFGTTIKDNIAYGKDGATIEQIKAAAELASAAKFISKMPQGFDTMVGEHGAQLSGGQKQRIAIALAILKDPRILLLDEATSALDAQSERIVQKALDRVMVNRTTVVVTHRLSTTRNADMIAVVQHGSIVEKGTGAYSQLIRLQGIHDKEELPLKDLDEHQEDLKVIDSVGITQKSPHRNSSQNIEAPILVLGSIAAAVSGMTFPVLGLLLSSIIHSFYEPDEHKLRKDATFWALMFIVLGVTCFIATPARMFCFAIAGDRLIRRLRLLTYENVLQKEIGWFDENSSGAITARLSTDAANVRSMVGDALCLLVQNFATIVSGIVIAFTENWQLALLVLALLPLMSLQGWVQIKFMIGFSRDAKVMYEEATQVASDAVGSIRTVASFCARRKNPSDKSGTTLANVRGDIEFRHVRFRFPTRPDMQIFQGLCLLVRSGQSVALVDNKNGAYASLVKLHLGSPSSGVK
eukprot:Gb_01715 [translate_table: standard]